MTNLIIGIISFIIGIIVTLLYKNKQGEEQWKNKKHELPYRI